MPDEPPRINSQGERPTEYGHAAPGRLHSAGERPMAAQDFESLDEVAPELAKEQRSVKLKPGDVVAGRFEVMGLLGFGGMGAVYRVKDRQLGGEKALKVMLPSLFQSKEARDRFRAEVAISQKLRHDRIVTVYDLAADSQRRFYFFTMEYVEGKTLHRVMQDAGGRLPVEQAMDIALQLCDALEYAHRYTLHRDLKPQNIMVQPDGEIKVLDFGLAKLMSPGQLTKSSMALGTAYYQSPEQSVRLAELDQRADLYSVGVILYQMLTGEIPMGRIQTPSQLEHSIPKRLDNIVLTCLEPRPENRFASASVLRDALNTRPSRGIIRGSALAAAIGILIGLYLTYAKPDTASQGQSEPDRKGDGDRATAAQQSSGSQLGQEAETWLYSKYGNNSELNYDRMLVEEAKEGNKMANMMLTLDMIWSVKDFETFFYMMDRDWKAILDQAIKGNHEAQYTVYRCKYWFNPLYGPKWRAQIKAIIDSEEGANRHWSYWQVMAASGGYPPAVASFVRGNFEWTPVYDVPNILEVAQKIITTARYLAEQGDLECASAMSELYRSGLKIECKIDGEIKEAKIVSPDPALSERYAKIVREADVTWNQDYRILTSPYGDPVVILSVPSLSGDIQICYTAELYYHESNYAVAVTVLHAALVLRPDDVTLRRKLVNSLQRLGIDPIPSEKARLSPLGSGSRDQTYGVLLVQTTRVEAEELKSRLESMRYAEYEYTFRIVPTENTWESYRVVMGDFDDEDLALRTRDSWRSRGYPGAYVVALSQPGETKAEFIEYTVGLGDTLYLIMRDFNVSKAKLVSLNGFLSGLTETSQLVAGQKLRVPALD